MNLCFLLRISAIAAASSRWTSRENGTQPYFHHRLERRCLCPQKRGSLCGHSVRLVRALKPPAARRGRPPRLVDTLDPSPNHPSGRGSQIPYADPWVLAVVATP